MVAPDRAAQTPARSTAQQARPHGCNTAAGVSRKGCASEEGGGELVVVVGPPAAPAVVAVAATGPVPHLDGVRVTGVDAAPGGCFDAGDGIVHGGEQLRPAVPVQSVGVGDES